MEDRWQLLLLLFVYQVVHLLSEGAFENYLRIHLGLPNIAFPLGAGVWNDFGLPTHQIDSNKCRFAFCPLLFLKQSVPNSKEHLWPTHPSLHYTRWNPTSQKICPSSPCSGLPPPKKKRIESSSGRLAYLWPKYYHHFSCILKFFASHTPQPKLFRGCSMDFCRIILLSGKSYGEFADWFRHDKLSSVKFPGLLRSV